MIHARAIHIITKTIYASFTRILQGEILTKNLVTRNLDLIASENQYIHALKMNSEGRIALSSGNDFFNGCKNVSKSMKLRISAK